MTDGVAVARELLLAHHPARALETLGPELARDPDNAQALVLAVHAALAVGRTSDALSWAERASALEPGRMDVVEALVLAQSNAGRHARAIAIAEEAVRRFPESSSAHELVADTYASAGRRSGRAVRAAETAVRLAPLDPGAHHALGRVRLVRGESRRARASFEQTLRLDPTHYAAQHNLALVRAQSFDGFGAARDLADLARTGQEREQSIAGLVRVVSGSVLFLCLALGFTSLRLGAIFGDAAPAWRWAIVAAGFAVPALTLGWSRIRLGSHWGAVVDESRRRNRLLVVPVLLLPLAPACWAVAAVLPTSGGTWFALGAVPALLGAATLLIGRRVQRASDNGG